MEKRLPGLDHDALRSFVTGMECGSFAQAALRLSRSTSAVSAQLKKLESQCGAALVTKQGRHLVLTAEGEKLMSYARRLLALNDETLRALQGERLTGEIHLGLQVDFGESLPVPDAFPRHCLSRCRWDPLAGGVRQPQPERHLGGGAGRAGPDDTHPHRHARQPAPRRRTPASARKSGRQPATNPA